MRNETLEGNVELGTDTISELGGSYTTIIPARSEDPFLKQAIDSVLAQSAPPGPIMVVVNGSDPQDSQTAQTVRKYQGRVQLLKTKETEMKVPGSAIVTALNHGISMTKTEFVAFLDSDDLWVSDKQERQLDLLNERPFIDAATCLASNFRVQPDGIRTDLATAEAVMFTATLFRASTFVKFGELDPESTHFTFLYKWWSSARENGIQTASIETVGTLRRIHDNNSWVVENKNAHEVLFSELRAIVQRRRSGQTQGNE